MCMFCTQKSEPICDGHWSSSVIFRPHRSTTYVDAACCYIQSSVVCLSVFLSVCHNVSPVKTAEPIEMSLGMWTQAGPRKHVLDGVRIGATWRIRPNRPCAAAMRPSCQITLTTFIDVHSLQHLSVHPSAAVWCMRRAACEFIRQLLLQLQT